MVVEKEVLKTICFDETIYQHEDMDFYIKIGKSFGGWMYYDEYLTIVHWEKEKKIQDFESMIIFYNRYKFGVVDPNNLARYLTWAWVCAARLNETYKEFYLNELKGIFWKVNIKYKCFILFRDPIFWLWKYIFRK